MVFFLLVFVCLFCKTHTHFPFFLGKGYPIIHFFVPCFFHLTIYPKSYSKSIHKDLPHSFPGICKGIFTGISLVAQWLRIRLPMQGTRVRSLILEDPTCRGATKPVSTITEPALYSPRATTTEPACHNY